MTSARRGDRANVMWGVIAIAVLLHGALAVTVAPRLEVDSAAYLTQAEALVAHGASLDADGRPETRYPPGYPAFLAIFLATGQGVQGAITAQHILAIGVVAAAMWLAARGSGSALAVSVAGLVSAFDVPGLISSATVLSETLAAATLAAAVGCTVLSRRATSASAGISWATAAGVLAGVTALVRPIAIGLGAMLAIAILIGVDWRRRTLTAAVLLVAFAVLPAWWTMRNARETGVATFSSLAGINLLHYRAAGTLAIRDPGGIDANLGARRDELEQRACQALEAEYGRPCSAISWAERSATYAAIAWPVLLGDPAATARQAARALGMIVLGANATGVSQVTGVNERVARIVCLAYTVPLAAMALTGSVYWWKRDRWLAGLLLLVVGYMIGAALGAEAYSRFRVPITAMYAVLAGGGAVVMRERLTS